MDVNVQKKLSFIGFVNRVKDLEFIESSIATKRQKDHLHVKKWRTCVHKL